MCADTKRIRTFVAVLVAIAAAAIANAAPPSTIENPPVPSPKLPEMMDAFERHMLEVVIPVAELHVLTIGSFSPDARRVMEERVRVMRWVLQVYRSIRIQQPVQHFVIREGTTDTHVITITIPSLNSSVAHGKH